MEILQDIPKAEDYVSLRIRSGMGEKNIEKAHEALKNSLFSISLWEENQLIAFGRIVGDGAITYVVSDIMVDQNYQGLGYGKIIMENIDRYLNENTDKDSYVCLIANRPADRLYGQFKFEHVEPYACGMKRNQSK